MDSDKRYRIELNERQLKVIYNALEEWFRISLGQVDRVTARLVFYKGADLSKADNKELGLRCKHAADVMRVAWDIATGRMLVLDADKFVAEDMWQVLRDEVYYPELVRWDSMMSDEPPIKVEEID